MRYEISTRENFDESRYLFSNPDVLDGISRGEFKTAFEHFERHGYLEGRCQKLEIKSDSPLGIVHIPKCAGTSLREEIQQVNQDFYRGTKYSIRGNRSYLNHPVISKAKKLELESTTWTLKELNAARMQYDWVMGHISLSDYYRAGFNEFIIILREPRIRVLSEFLFMLGNEHLRDALKSKFGVRNTKNYFTNYGWKYSRNVIANLVSAPIIFDWGNQVSNVSCYWNDEISLLMAEVFGKKEVGFKSNSTSIEVVDLDYRVLDLVHELTAQDSLTLNRLMNSGLLSQRSKERMEEEFQRYLKTNFNYVKSLI